MLANSVTGMLDGSATKSGILAPIAGFGNCGKDRFAVVAMIVDALGVRSAPHPADVRRQVDTKRFFWLDIFSAEGAASELHLGELDLSETDIAWALRFGQAGRMLIGRDVIRVVTWMAEGSGNLIEIHVICSPQGVVTVWNGDASALDEIRQQFAERVCGFEDNVYHAAGILLQLLLGTLDHAIRELDVMLDELRFQIDKDTSSADFALLTRRRQKLQSIVGGFNRYSSAVRSAIVGVEALPGMDSRGAAELNDYAEQVEDVEEQFQERRRWLSDMMHDYSTTIAERQMEQINRLTLVSLIFLPMTAITGFFGMNFEWMMKALSSKEAFFVLGLALPTSCVVLTIAWLAHRRMIPFRLRPKSSRASQSNIAAAKERPFNAKDIAYSELRFPEKPPEDVMG